MKLADNRAGSRISSLMWRAMSRYGEFKYAHLLPIYRALGLLTRKPGGDAARSRPAVRVAEALTRRLKGAKGSLRALPEIVERAKAARGTIIFLPSVGWETVNTQRVHHLAREFARQGYLSIFDCSGTFSDVNGFRRVAPDLFLFRGNPGVLSEIPEPTLWTVTQNFDQVSRYPTPARTVYDWIDDLSVFPFDRRFLEANHSRALKEATLVLSVARPLLDQATSVRGDALYVPNGVDYEHFAAEAPVPDKDPAVARLLETRMPTAGYYGALAEWFDYELLDAVAAQRADWNFLLIGPMLDSSAKQRGRALFKRKNVYAIGPRRYEQLPGYLRLFDVAMIPFVVNDITKATSPLKLYEYLAAGKPIVSTPMPACDDIALVRVVRNATEMEAALDAGRVRSADEGHRAESRAIALEHSWAKRVQAVTARFG